MAAQPADRRLFLFVNVSAIHQPNRLFLPGAGDDTPASMAAALAYVDRHVPMLLRMFEKRLRGYRAIGYARGEAPLGYVERSDERVVEYDEEVLDTFDHEYDSELEE